MAETSASIRSPSRLSWARDSSAMACDSPVRGERLFGQARDRVVGIATLSVSACTPLRLAPDLAVLLALFATLFGDTRSDLLDLLEAFLRGHRNPILIGPVS